MPLSFHTDPDQKIEQQYKNTLESLIPYISRHKQADRAWVLEIGCGEGGNLKAFADSGSVCYGIDLSENKIATARRILEEEIKQGKVHLIPEDIHRLSDEKELHHKFDMVVMKDVIEHVPEKEKLLTKIHEFLREDGIVFLAFPPWYNPYGGHQQMSKSLLGKMPYFHLLPHQLSAGYLQLVGESRARIKGFLEVVDTRLTIRQFEQICRKTGYEILEKEFYLINPIYKYKFGLKPRRQLPVLRNIPVLRDFISTSVYYVIRPMA
jgi:SAM-dependent methyltransferase